MTITTVQKPQTDWRDSDYYAALRWVNERRVLVRGCKPLDELLCGQRLTFDSCPIARSIGERFMDSRHSRLHYECPIEVVLFARKFDLGHYPALVEN